LIWPLIWRWRSTRRRSHVRPACRRTPWQARLLRSQARQLLLNCTRQAGKSTCTAALALHQALYQPGPLVLLLAPALRQSQELFRKVKHFASALDLPNEAIEGETSLRIELVNGGRIETLPGKEGTIRGFSAVSLLIVDEAARVADELYRAIRPMLAVSGGRVVLLSSPFGRRGFSRSGRTAAPDGSAMRLTQCRCHASRVPS
jgi:hypothetical protein